MLRRGSAGSNTAADHLQLLDDGDRRGAAGVPPEADGHLRRRRSQPRPGKRLDKLASRRGYELAYSVGWALGEREKTALGWSPSRPGRPRSTAAARSASAALMWPAGTRGAGTGRAG